MKAEFLLTVAEIEIPIAGFAGLIAAIARTCDGELGEARHGSGRSSAEGKASPGQYACGP